MKQTVPLTFGTHYKYLLTFRCIQQLGNPISATLSLLRGLSTSKIHRKNGNYSSQLVRACKRSSDQRFGSVNPNEASETRGSGFAKIDASWQDARSIEIFDMLTAMTAIGPRKSARAASLKNATRHERTVVLPAKPDLDAREWGRACLARKYNRISSIFKSSFFWRRQSRLEVGAGRRRERRRGPARMKISPFLGIRRIRKSYFTDDIAFKGTYEPLRARFCARSWKTRTYWGDKLSWTMAFHSPPIHSSDRLSLTDLWMLQRSAINSRFVCFCNARSNTTNRWYVHKYGRGRLSY